MAVAQSFTPEAPHSDPMSQFREEAFAPEPLRAEALLPKPPRFVLGGVPVDRISMDDAAAFVINRLKNRRSGKPLLIMGPNAQLVALAASNSRFATALKSAYIAVPDGISVVLAARLLNRPVPERVPGGELMERLCFEAAQHDLSVFFLGGLPGAAEKAARKFERNYPGFQVAGVCCPERGFENDPAENARICQRIISAKPDLLCVALGAPKQELWMHENCSSLPIGAAISVGAALDTQAGLRKRAPMWVRKIGLEWLYRLCHEPRRLWRRYLLGNTRFLLIVARQWWREERANTAFTAAEREQ